MHRKILALLLAGTLVCTSEVTVLAEDDQIFGFDTEDERVWDNSDPFVYESEMAEDFFEDEWPESEMTDEEDTISETEDLLEEDFLQEDDSEWEIEYEINPIYQDVIAEDDLNTSVPVSGIMFFADPSEYCTTTEEVAAIIREAMVNRTKKVVVYYRSEVPYDSGLVPRWTSAARAHTGIPNEGDYLALDYAGASWSRKSVTGDDGYYYLTVTITLTMYTDADGEAAVTEKISELIGSFDFTAETTEIQRFDRIYRWICENVAYDYDTEGNVKYTSYGALFNHKAVCQGYTSLLYRMLLTAGVSARAITGKSGSTNHAWNIARSGDFYYNADSTWDAPSIAAKSEALPYSNYYKCMLKSNANFDGHTRGSAYSTDEFNMTYPMSALDYRAQAGVSRYQISFDNTSDRLTAEIRPVQKYQGIGCLLPTAAGKGRPYQISFDSTGGSSVKPVSYACQFVGWNTSADGSGKSYAAYDFFEEDQETMLYPQWSEDTVGELPVPVRKNYVFEGWYTKEQGGELIREDTQITEDMTCYAHWKALVSGVSLNQSEISIKRTAGAQLSADVAPTEAANKKVTWKSSDTAVVSTDSNGKLKGLVPGEAVVTVTTDEGGYTAACKVKVCPVDDAEAFVTRLYNVVLDRRPDLTGLNYWTEPLRSRKWTGEKVARGFIFSTEFTRKQLSDAEFVEYLYKAILGRTSDPIGKAYWCNLLKKSGYTRERVFNGFINSTEFGRLCDQYGILRR